MKDDFFIEKAKKEMDTLMDEIVGFSRISLYRKTHFSPPVDIYEANNRFVIITDVAGIDKKQISITVSDDVLIIKGERQRSNAIEENLCYYHMEIEYGPFERRIRIPRNIDMENMDIVYDNGLLKIEIPLVTKQVRKIEID
ncbi:MAG: Hsp20/alpha crystallin family protein [bacterium]|nr:Hsp20/alpha crystallin family protein [bacterium]